MSFENTSAPREPSDRKSWTAPCVIVADADMTEKTVGTFDDTTTGGLPGPS